MEYRINSIIKKYNRYNNKSLGDDVTKYFLKIIPVDKYENMRDINKRIKMEFVKYIEAHDSAKKNNTFFKKLFSSND